MYLEFYNLKEKPFSLTPDPAFLFYSKVHKRAIAFLKYGLQESKGFLQLTGPIGSGKTTLLRAILSELDESAKTAYIMNPCAPFPDLLRSIMKDLEIPNIPQTRLKMELLDFFHEYLLAQMRRSNPVIVIFDEAQNLSLKNLEEIRMLSNFETTKGKLIQIVLVGQPELVKTINRPELKQLKQRIQVRYHLSALNLSEVKEYIGHRLRVAGSDGGILFTEGACAAIYEFSNGIPRLINSVCDIALLIGYVNERKDFDEGVVKEAIGELNGSFSAEPLEPCEDATPPAGGEPGGRPDESGEADNRLLDKAPSGVSQSLGIEAKAEFPDGPNKGSGTVLRKKDSSPNAEIHPVTSRGVSAVVVVKAETSTDIADRTPEADDLEGSPENQNGPGGAAARYAAGDVHMARPRQRRLASERPQEPRGELFHSLLRHAGTGRFHIAGSGITGAIRRRSVPTILAEFFRKFIPGKNGSGSLASEDLIQGISGAAMLDGQEKGFPSTVLDSIPTANEPPFEIDCMDSPAATEKITSCGGPKDAPRGKPARAGRASRGRSITRRTYRQPDHFIDSKVHVLLKDGRTALGSTKDISVKDVGFYLFPPKSQNGAKQIFIAFEQTLALHFLNNFEESRKRKFFAECSRPKTRQIIATLLNGEVIEGITPRKFDVDCNRFFVFSTDEKGNSLWSLVERDGTAGILAEDIAEGIYAEHPISLSDLGDISKTDAGSGCRHESAGDSFFSVNDFAAALVEYEKAGESAPDPKRLELKISLAHLNQGMECMKRNEYLKAKIEFGAVSTDGRLRELAQAKAEMVQRMLRG